MRDDPGSDTTIALGRGPQRQLGRVDWLLLELFVALEVADIVATNHGLSLSGAREVNPLMAAFQSRLGAAWWLPKALAVSWIAVAAMQTRRQWPLIFAVTFCGLVFALDVASF
jgi:hypothetical protein